MKEEVEECVPAIPADADHTANNEFKVKKMDVLLPTLHPLLGNHTKTVGRRRVYSIVVNNHTASSLALRSISGEKQHLPE